MGFKIQEFADINELEEMLKRWEERTGISAILSGPDGRVLCSSGQKKGLREYAAEEDAAPLEIYGELLGSLSLGGESGQEDAERWLPLLVESVQNFLYAKYAESKYESMINRLSEGIEETHTLVKEIRKSTNDLKNIQSRQKILALNANIEAARAGEHGKGFGVVADEVGRLSDNSSAVNEKISDVVKRIGEVVSGLSIEG